ncbi:MAG: methyltransferase domain-containing protein [Thermoleophilia bacterium]|nr:methyltransferase domain-containing protein [Thermoleophilia bacterium]
MSGGVWEREAERWIAWARTPGHDGYQSYSEPFFAEIVPPPGRRTLEVGCGEGRVARDLRARGHDVVAVDAVPRLVEAARDADPDGEYLVADATQLPFADAGFDLVVAHNTLMDVEDMPAAVGEAARVLERGGRIAVRVTHPLSDAGRFASGDPDAPFVIHGSYFGRRRFEATVERAGLTMTFSYWTYPLEDYVGALAAAGLLVERLREPRPALERSRRQRIPNFLDLRAVKP